METYINFWFYETQRRDRVSQLLYHMCKQNWQARRKSRKDQTSMKQSNTGHKKRERNRKKKLKLSFRSICPSPFKSAVLMISLTSSSVNWLWRFIIVHLNSSALINPLPSMSNTLNISRISASVSVSFIRVSIGGEILKSQWCHCLEKKCKSSSV